MEVVINIVALVLSLLLAIIKSMRYTPNGLSDFELNRQVHAGNQTAMAEQERRLLLPTFISIQYSKEIIISVAIAALLLTTHSSAIGTFLSLFYFTLAYVIAARGWFTGVAGGWQRLFERLAGRLVHRMAPFMHWLAPRPGERAAGAPASREELRELIEHDTTLLSPQDRTRALAAMDFGGLLVSDAMVPRDKIATVEYDETVGPVLLDRLHKQGHHIFLVIKKDLNHIKGWLYMADLVPLDPEIKAVKDAVRTKVHYLSVETPLQDVLAASLLTGRQLFVAVNEAGETQGLVTLADTLARINGAPIPEAAPVQTHP